MSNFLKLFRCLPRYTVLINNITARNCGKLSGATHRVNNLERKFLVWTGKFKTTEEVPSFIAPEIVEKARNRIRIRLANIMMVLTLLGCLAVAISGKKAHERGESVTKRNLEWHKKQQEEEKQKEI